MAQSAAQKAALEKARAAKAKPAASAEEAPQQTAGESLAQVTGTKTTVGDLLDSDEFTGNTTTMVFPKKVRLTLDTYNYVDFDAGIQEVPDEIADHWYLKAHGVQKHEKKRQKKAEAEAE